MRPTPAAPAARIRLPRTEPELVGLCLALIGGYDDLSAAESALAATAPDTPIAAGAVHAARRAITRGADPLGDAFSSIRGARTRRTAGAVYTPPPIVRSMTAWLGRQRRPERIVSRAPVPAVF